MIKPNLHLAEDRAAELQKALAHLIKNAERLILPGSPAWDAFIRPAVKTLVKCQIADQQRENIEAGDPTESQKKNLRRLYDRHAKLNQR